jgi:L-arginine dehydrogenase
MSDPGFPVLGASDVARLSTGLDLASALRDAFAGLESGRSHQPPQTVVAFGDGADAIVYPAAVEDLGVVSVKLSPYLPGRTPPVTAWTLLLSTETGNPVLLCDSATLTAERTAGTTALAVDYLAPDGASVLAVIGSGPLAAAHLRHVMPLRRFDEVRVFSPSAARGDEERRARMTAAAAGAEFRPTVEAAVTGADVVLLCTSSGEPVLEAAATEPDALITSISTNKPRAHEIPPRDLAELAVYCDYRATAPLAAGEMVIAGEDGAWSPSEIVADLPELVSGAAPPRPAGRAYFRSIGLGIEDAAVAVALLRAL